MSGGAKLNAAAGGSVTMVADDTLTTDEVVVVQDPIGVNQTWRDMIGQRAYGVWYTNNSGAPIQVAASAYSTGGNSLHMFYIDNIPVATTGNSLHANAYGSFQCIVPDGSSYIIRPGSSSTTGVVTTWSELRGD